MLDSLREPETAVMWSEGAVVATVVSCNEEEVFMAADEAENVLPDLL